jgi:hypothetical protein
MNWANSSEIWGAAPLDTSGAGATKTTHHRGLMGRAEISFLRARRGDRVGREFLAGLMALAPGSRGDR